MRHTKQISRTNFGPANTRRRFDVIDQVFATPSYRRSHITPCGRYSFDESFSFSHSVSLIAPYHQEHHPSGTGFFLESNTADYPASI